VSELDPDTLAEIARTAWRARVAQRRFWKLAGSKVEARELDAMRNAERRLDAALDRLHDKQMELPLDEPDHGHGTAAREHG